jgi:hypothetical protein
LLSGHFFIKLKRDIAGYHTLMAGVVIPNFVPISVFIFLIVAISSSMRYLAFLSSSISLVRDITKAREPVFDLFEGVADLRES